MQGTERFELCWRTFEDDDDEASSALEVKLCWWYQPGWRDDPGQHGETVEFDSLAALTAAMQTAVSERRIRMDVSLGKTASGQQCVVVARGDHEVTGQPGSRAHVAAYPRFVKRFVGPATHVPWEVLAPRLRVAQECVLVMASMQRNRR